MSQASRPSTTKKREYNVVGQALMLIAEQELRMAEGCALVQMNFLSTWSPLFLDPLGWLVGRVCTRRSVSLSSFIQQHLGKRAHEVLVFTNGPKPCQSRRRALYAPRRRRAGANRNVLLHILCRWTSCWTRRKRNRAKENPGCLLD